MSKRIGCLFLTIVFSYVIHAQEKVTPQKTFLEGEYFFMNEDYPDALNFYLQLYETMPDNSNLAYRIGVCYLNIPGKKKLSVEYLEKATQNMSAKHKEGTINQKAAPYDALYNLGKAYRLDYKFDKAKEVLKKYLGTLLKDDRENIDFINHEIEVCDMAKDLIAKPIKYKEENIGEQFNDAESNFNPVISADGKSFAYMISLKFYDAIVFSRLIDGKWTTPVNITPELESDGDFYISSLSADGSILFLSKDDNFDSDIYSSSYNGVNWSKTVKLNRYINTKYWESHGFITEDGESLIFSSDRPGGYGGLDLYISRKVNGDWGPAANLGGKINTRFNEDRAFLINNGKTLFFSSQGHQNMGGYDIFRSDIQSDARWGNAENLGYSINTPDDNFFFMPIGDGSSGYYSEYKESESFGKQDIYLIKIISDKLPRKFIVSGTVKTADPSNNNKVVKISVINIKKPDQKVVVDSNPETGNYEINLPQGEYQLIYESKGNQKIIKNVNLTSDLPSDRFVVPATILQKEELIADLNEKSNETISEKKSETPLVPRKAKPAQSPTDEKQPVESLPEVKTDTVDQNIIADSTKIISKDIPSDVIASQPAVEKSNNSWLFWLIPGLVLIFIIFVLRKRKKEKEK